MARPGATIAHMAAQAKSGPGEDEYTLILDSDIARTLVSSLDEKIAELERRSPRRDPVTKRARRCTMNMVVAETEKQRLEEITRAIRRAWLEENLLSRQNDTPVQ